MIQLLPENDAAKKVASGSLVVPGQRQTVLDADAIYVRYIVNEDAADDDARLVMLLLSEGARKAHWRLRRPGFSDCVVATESVQALDMSEDPERRTRRMVFVKIRTVGADKA